MLLQSDQNRENLKQINNPRRYWSDLKGLKKENLRDNMSTTKIILNILAETATEDISARTKPETFTESRKVAKRGGSIAGNAWIKTLCDDCCKKF